jgi:hypothetical protein
MSHTLISALRALGRSQLVQDAEVLVQERQEALADAWAVRQENEALRTRLRQVIAERNALRRS